MNIVQLFGFPWLTGQCSIAGQSSTHKKGSLLECFLITPKSMMGFPGISVVKNPPSNAGDMGLIPESGRSPGEGNGIPLQYSCLGNSMNRAGWQATVHGVAKSPIKLSN